MAVRERHGQTLIVGRIVDRWTSRTNTTTTRMIADVTAKITRLGPRTIAIRLSNEEPETPHPS